MPISEDSGEETSQDDQQQPVTSWNDMSIIDRVGLNSSHMTEEEVETAFSQIALAFRCDQYTLKQRLQAEEHARNLAEENIQLELTRSRETLETLKVLCLDSKRHKILQSLELCLHVLGGTVERISNTAEILGAVHQEARASRAVELMVEHVENLQKRHDRDNAALEHTRKRMLKSRTGSRRVLIEPRVADESEILQKVHKPPQQHHGRRRVSISVISKQAQEKRKKERDSKKQATLEEGPSKKTALSTPSPSQTQSPKDNSLIIKTKHLTILQDGRPTGAASGVGPGAAAVPQPSQDPSLDSVSGCPAHQPHEEVIRKIQSNSSPLVTLGTLRHRHKSKTMLEKKKENRKKKIAYWKQFIMGTCGPICSRHPLAHWLYHRVLLCIYLLLLGCVIMFSVFLWNLYTSLTRTQPQEHSEEDGRSSYWFQT